EMNAGEHLGVGLGAFGIEFDLAAGDLVTAALENQHDVVRGAAARGGKHQFHGARRQVAAAAFGGAIHGGDVAATRACHEEHALGATPVDCSFHLGSCRKSNVNALS